MAILTAQDATHILIPELATRRTTFVAICSKIAFTFSALTNARSSLISATPSWLTPLRPSSGFSPL